MRKIRAALHQGAKHVEQNVGDQLQTNDGVHVGLSVIQASQRRLVNEENRTTHPPSSQATIGSRSGFAVSLQWFQSASAVILGSTTAARFFIDTMSFRSTHCVPPSPPISSLFLCEVEQSGMLHGDRLFTSNVDLVTLIKGDHSTYINNSFIPLALIRLPRAVHLSKVLPLTRF
jgi:hypothetical protein